MNEQVGWRGLWQRLKQEAPRYSQLLPALPRLAVQRLQAPAGTSDALLAALLVEQRRTNRLLQGLIWAGLGFVLGAVAVRLWPWLV
jgi:ubiquinone biosynthesis protein